MKVTRAQDRSIDGGERTAFEAATRRRYGR
jgi:hypothetical protein